MTADRSRDIIEAPYRSVGRQLSSPAHATWRPEKRAVMRPPTVSPPWIQRLCRVTVAGHGSALPLATPPRAVQARPRSTHTPAHRCQRKNSRRSPAVSPNRINVRRHRLAGIRVPRQCQRLATTEPTHVRRWPPARHPTPAAEHRWAGGQPPIATHGP